MSHLSYKTKLTIEQSVASWIEKNGKPSDKPEWGCVLQTSKLLQRTLNADEARHLYLCWKAS